MEEYIYYIQNRGLQKTELFYNQAKCLIWTLVVQNSYYHSKTPRNILFWSSGFQHSTGENF
jgi:hypothetical protein